MRHMTTDKTVIWEVQLPRNHEFKIDFDDHVLLSDRILLVLDLNLNKLNIYNL